MSAGATIASRLGHRPVILLAEDDHDLCELIAMQLQADGFDVVACLDGLEAARVLPQTRPDLVVTDLRMPGLDGLGLLRRVKAYDAGIPVLVLTGVGSVESAVETLKQGAAEYVEKPVDHHRLRQVVRDLLLSRVAVRPREAPRDQGYHGIIGKCPQMKQVYTRIQRVAPYDLPALVVGESGTGKELVARALHLASGRADAPYIAFNAAGLVDTLVESELFGHVRGAFTGADRDHRGLFEEADGGTLFLDEIAEMNPNLQAKLLRVLENGEVRPVGSARNRRVDVRIVAATHQDLRSAMEEGTFREDLYYRLRGVVLHLPALRERGPDLDLLVQAFLDGVRKRLGVTVEGVSEDVMTLMRAYPWPGNVRELRQTVEAAAVLAAGGWITLAELPDDLRQHAGRVGQAPLPMSVDPATLQLDDVERNHVAYVLSLDEGNKTAAAERLGISRHALYRLLRKHGLG